MVAPFKSYSKSLTLKRMAKTDDGRWLQFSSYQLTASGISQKPPYVNTAYTSDIKNYLYGRFTDVASWSVTPYSEEGAGARTFATNLAKARFVSQLGEASQLGSSLTTERKGTYDTAVGTLLNLGRSARALRRGRLAEAAEHLGIPTDNFPKKKKNGTKLPIPGKHGVKKFTADVWLWWSYAISPMCGDLYNAMDVLQRPFPYMKIEGSGTGVARRYIAGVVEINWKCNVKVSADVWVKNPNLWLANQLGLINPVQMLNEGIPFSFVFDWFSNLSQVISQLTDFVGLEIANPMTAEKSYVKYETSTPYEGKERWFKTRALTMPSAKLRFAYERFHWQRGANAISLLIGFLPNRR